MGPCCAPTQPPRGPNKASRCCHDTFTASVLSAPCTIFTNTIHRLRRAGPAAEQEYWSTGDAKLRIVHHLYRSEPEQRPHWLVSLQQSYSCAAINSAVAHSMYTYT